MTILVKDYTWSQTRDMLHIRIPLNPVNHEKVDFFPTNKYIKAHFSPFLFEVFLLYDVDINKSKCFVKEDLIYFDLLKMEARDWECLEKKLTKKEKRAIRQEVIQKCQEEAKQQSEDRQVKKGQLDKFTVQQAIEIDTKQHNLMDSKRDNVRKEAIEALEERRVNKTEEGIKTQDNVTPKVNNFRPECSAGPQREQNCAQITELTPSDDENEKNDPKTNDTKINEVKDENGKTVNVEAKETPVENPFKTPVKSEYVESKKEELDDRVLPLKETANLEIKHTPRSFPTPSRESQAEEEQGWLKDFARRAGCASKDWRPEEHDPQWCKVKGDDFFKKGNFLGAISAYSHGIALTDNLPSLFASRAASHFEIGNFNKCINDCTTALDLMKPPCESNRYSRAKCIAKRAAALAKIGRLNIAIEEMKVASKLVPQDKTIKKDMYDMKRAWEPAPDSD